MPARAAVLDDVVLPRATVVVVVPADASTVDDELVLAETADVDDELDLPLVAGADDAEPLLSLHAVTRATDATMAATTVRRLPLLFGRLILSSIASGEAARRVGPWPG